MFTGVYKAQIDAFQPKVTIVGNVDAQTLIKKLAKTGKAAEVWPSESKKPLEEEKKADNSGKEVEISTTNVKDKAKDKDIGKKSDSKECKCSTCPIASKSKGNEGSDPTGGNKKEEKLGAKGAKNGTSNSGSISEVTKGANPVPQPGIVLEAVNVVPCVPYYYPMEPPAVHPTYYTVGAYLPAPPCYVRDHYLYEYQLSRPPVQSTAPRLTDYFNDDNTNACSVM